MDQRMIVTVKKDAVPATGAAVVEATADLAIAVFRVAGDYYAIDNRCPHKGGPLGAGSLDGTVVTCPWHKFTVDVRTGRNPRFPGLRVRTFAVEDSGDELCIVIAEAACP
jgi:nitrite reductase/ring-hydroxylating ferredoxin subunit